MNVESALALTPAAIMFGYPCQGIPTGQPPVEELLSLYAPEIELLPLTGTLVGSGGYRGHSGVRNYFAEAEAVWDVVRPEPEAMHAVGDDVIVFGHCAIRGKASKLETREAMAWVITVRDRKVVRHRACRTAEDALEAAGMQE